MAVDVSLARRRDARPVAYLLAAGSALIVALFTGQVALAAFAAPFAAVLLTAKRAPATLVAEFDVLLERTRAIEGDELTGTLRVTAPAGTANGALLDGCTAEALCTPSRDLTVIEPEPARIAAAGRLPVDGAFRVRAERWGRFVVGPTAIRLRHPLALDHWEGSLQRGPTALVLPNAPRLDRILDPRSSHTTAGFHLARRSLGAGLDFAELQQYQPGDRLRDLNRAATARHRTPIVNRYHPERAGEVVIVLDTFLDAALELSQASRRALITQARAVWAVTQAHLSAQDRVGIATVGRIPVWLPPQAGARARYAILESLLSVGAVLDGRSALAEALDAGKVSPAALVVFVSPLWSDTYLTSIERLAARGRETVVIQLDTAAMTGVAEPRSALAQRLFRMAAVDRAARLRRAGLPVVEWHPDRRLGTALNAAANLQRRRRALVGGR